MKMISLHCPNCGFVLDIPERQGKHSCPACGSKLYYTDGNIHIVDDARICFTIGSVLLFILSIIFKLGIPSNLFLIALFGWFAICVGTPVYISRTRPDECYDSNHPPFIKNKVMFGYSIFCVYVLYYVFLMTFSFD